MCNCGFWLSRPWEPEWKVWSFPYPVKFSLAPWKAPGWILPTTPEGLQVACAHHSPNSCFPSSESGAYRCQWEHCVQGCRERLSAIDVVIMHLVLFILKELPKVTNEMNPNLKETSQNGSPGGQAPEEQQCTDCWIQTWLLASPPNTTISCWLKCNMWRFLGHFFCHPALLLH